MYPQTHREACTHHVTRWNLSGGITGKVWCKKQLTWQKPQQLHVNASKASIFNGKKTKQKPWLKLQWCVQIKRTSKFQIKDLQKRWASHRSSCSRNVHLSILYRFMEDWAHTMRSLVLKSPTMTAKAACECAELQWADAGALNAVAESATGHALQNWTWRPDIFVASGTLSSPLLFVAQSLQDSACLS